MPAKSTNLSTNPASSVSRRSTTKKTKDADISTNLNFLPEDRKVNDSTIRLAKILRSVTVFGLVIFVLAAGGMIAFAFYNANLIKNSKDEQDKLKSEVSTLQQTEQSFILLKDRITKIDKILAADPTGKKIENVQTISNSFPSGVEIRTLKVSSDDSVEISIFVPNSLVLSDVLKTVANKNFFSIVTLNTFTSIETGGYLLTVVAT